MHEPTTRNREFYDDIYKSRGWLLDRLLPYIGYDQLSKSRPNIACFLRHSDGIENTQIDVFDYGCGRGLFLFHFPANKMLAYGLDIAPSALKSLKSKKWPKGRDFVAVEHEDFARGDYADSFDVCCASHILEHVPEDRTVAVQLVESLKPGGLLIVNVPINEIFPDENHVRAYDATSICALFADLPVELLEYTECDRFSGYIIYHEQRKPAKKLRRLVMKVLRGFLAVQPIFLLGALENILPPKYPMNQAVLAFRKRNART